MKKTISLLCLMIVVFASCSSPKKTPAKAPVTTITREDRLNGGTSYSNAVMLKVTTEREGLDEEYKWLRTLYPGYSLIRRSSVKRSSRNYDIIRIKTAQGKLKDIYFDSTSFAGGR